MRTSLRFVLAGTALIIAAGPGRGQGPPPAAPPEPDRITQVSVLNALMLGQYDGVMPLPELLRRGDFGLGTIDHLDGELIVLEGNAYQVRGDGRVLPVGPERTTPFAVVTPFEADGDRPCPPVASLAELDARLATLVPGRNRFVALRIDSRLSSVTVRSVKRQEPPYRPLADVAKDQSVWTRENVAGTLVGIRCPEWTTGLNVPGTHWHFLSDDHTVGGHVLDATVVEGRLRYDLCGDWDVRLPTSPDFDEADLGRDLSREVEQVEGARGGGAAPGR